jgi:peptidase E
MLEIWKQKGIDKLLRNAYEKGIVLSGLSAGANCWFKRFSTDGAAIATGAEKGTMLQIADGLDFLDGVFVPHLLREPLRRADAERALQNKKYAGETFYLADDRAALVSINGKISAISDDKNSAVRAMTYDKIFQYKILSKVWGLVSEVERT